MRLLINTATTYKGGGVQVARSFIEECKKFQDNEYHVILSQNLAALIDPEIYPENFFFYKIDYRPATRVFSFKPRDQYFKILEKEIQPDVVFTTSGPAYWRPEAPHLVGYNLPHYIYPESPYFRKISAIDRLKWKLKGRVIRYYFRNDADAYVVQTDDVKSRLKRFINKNRVYTVSNTFSDDYRQPLEVPNKLPDRKSNEFRFLSFSSWYPHKNLEIIPKVIEQLTSEYRDRFRFVVTLPENKFRSVFNEKYRKHMFNTGPVDPSEGPSLYRECDALFLPTLLECFSATYAEAMVMKKPIVTSDLGFARSICGDAALYVDPVDPKKITEKLINLAIDESIQEHLIRNGEQQVMSFLDSKGRTKAYLEICRELINSKNDEYDHIKEENT